jgi:4-carboxymuconolactone decarboxylase
MTEPTRQELRTQGLATRRQVLGDSYVDAALANATEFTQPLQDLLNEYCWGAAWSAGGLTPRERSIATLAMLVALGKPQEIETHTRGALNNGLDPREISQLLIHAAIYCGMPAAVEAFRAASRVIAERPAR